MARVRADIGSVYCIPLPIAGGCGLVVVSRRTLRARAGSAILLCYGFGPRLSTAPDGLPTLKPDDARYIAFVPEIQLHKSAWQLIGVLREFNPVAWPFPKFADCVAGYWREQPFREDTVEIDFDRHERRISQAQAAKCVDTGLNGVEYFADHLDKAITEGWKGREPVERQAARDIEPFRKRNRKSKK